MVGDFALKTVRSAVVGFVLLGSLFGYPPGVKAAQSLTLAWDQSADSSVTGYRVYYGGASRSYTNSVDAGTATSVTISGLEDGSTHFFAATAYNNIGLESTYSSEIAVTLAGTNGSITPPPGGSDITVSVSIVGDGTVTPDLNGETLTAGKTYTLTATPGAGQVFGGWTGSLSSSDPKLTFVATSSLALQASFVANPYGPMAGSYSGLFYEIDAVRISRSGTLAVSVTSKGTYSGRLRTASQRASFSGRLDVFGHGTNVITMKGGDPLNLNFQLVNGLLGEQMSGSISNPAFTAQLLGDRATFSIRTNPAPFAGTYTLLVPGSNGDTSLPAGSGFGFVRVNASGKARLAGMLADGTKFSQSASVASDGAWPLFAPLAGGSGQILSWLNFASQTNSDLSGALSWIKLPTMNAHFYPAGFSNVCEAIGSEYVAPVNQNILGLTQAQLQFSGGDLSTNVVHSFGLGPKSKVILSQSDQFSLSFSLSTGTFRGKTMDPATGSWLPFRGAVLPKLNTGYGFLLGPAHSSQVLLQP